MFNLHGKNGELNHDNYIISESMNIIGEKTKNEIFFCKPNEIINKNPKIKKLEISFNNKTAEVLLKNLNNEKRFLDKIWILNQDTPENKKKPLKINDTIRMG